MYDLTTIKRISKNDNAVISKYIHAFIKSSHEQLQDIDKLMDGNKWDGVADILHKMKTSVAYFGMNDIEQIVIQAEADIRNNVGKTIVEGQMEEIARLLTGSLQSLQEEINSLEGF